MEATEPCVQEDPELGLFRVARRAFTEPGILARERERVFGRCWLYVGHASEIAQPGDFLTRQVGGRELIFSRGRDGVVRSFFNTCPHRGAMVCRERAGNAAMFRCFYHSWAFNLEGRLVNRPGDEAYAQGTRREGLHDLVSVPRLAEYRGLYFVHFQADGEDLVNYLAGATEFIDLVMDQGEAGMEIVGGTQEYGFDANWKLLCENSIDGYHGLATHSSYFDYLKSKPGDLVDIVLNGEAFDLGNGHAVVQYTAPWGRPIAQAVPAWGDDAAREVAAIKARLVERFGAARAERIAGTNRNMLIFPNLVINDIMAITLRTFYPHSPDKQQVNAWTLAPADESPAMRERRLFNFLEFLGPGGFATPDDCEALSLCQRGYGSLGAGGWNDISKGYDNPRPRVDDEAQIRVFWREWQRRLQEAGA